MASKYFLTKNTHYHELRQSNAAYAATALPIELQGNRLSYKATGNADRLSQKLSISQWQTFRLLNHLREIGFPIVYCRTTETYYYSEEVKFTLQLKVGGQKIL